MPSQALKAAPLCSARPLIKRKKLHHKVEDALLAWFGLDLAWRDARARKKGGASRLLVNQPTPLEEQSPTRVALFVHFNARHHVSDMVLRYLDQLRAAGFAIQFISISPLPRDSDIVALGQRVSRIFVRQEFGRDIGAWCDIWQSEAHRFIAADEVLLVNDSVLGPLQDLGPVFAAMRRVPEGLIGLTDTPLIAPHLQSYFLLIRGASGIRTLNAFFDQLPVTDKKTRLVRRGEVGLSRFFQEAGLPLRSIFSYDRLEALVQAQTGAGPDLPAFNPTLAHWGLLVEQMGFPFIKTELLRQARSGTHGGTRDGPRTGAGDWARLVGLLDSELVPLLRAHLDDMNVPAR